MRSALAIGTVMLTFGLGAGAQAGDTTPVMPPRPGYYAVNSTCEVAKRDRYSGVVITNKYLKDIDGDYALLPVKALGKGRHSLGEAFEDLRQVSEGSYVDSPGMEHERRFTWCASAPPKG